MPQIIHLSTLKTRPESIHIGLLKQPGNGTTAMQKKYVASTSQSSWKPPPHTSESVGVNTATGPVVDTQQACPLCLFFQPSSSIHMKGGMVCSRNGEGGSISLPPIFQSYIAFHGKLKQAIVEPQ